MFGEWRWVGVLACAIGLALPGCGDDDAPIGDAGAIGIGDGGGVPGAAGSGDEPFYPVAEPSDPCSVAGYFFDGESDCNVVRCPQLSCRCSSRAAAGSGGSGGASGAGGVPVDSFDEVTLTGCVDGVGCLSLLDCNRVCDQSRALTRSACDARISGAGAQSCGADDDCVAGECREESVGSICVETMPCAEDGHCSAGSACLVDPEAVQSGSSEPTSLGTCADGSPQSRCYQDGQCVFGLCENERCNSGLDDSACELDRHCASGFCRITDTTDGTGQCVSGARGGSCADDGDCESDLHCTSGACYTSAVGQRCEQADQCESSVCIGGVCRGGEPGSLCEDDDDCDDGLCAGGKCVSGELSSLCYDPDDCKAGLTCARQVCSDGSKDAPCSTDADCEVHACVSGTCSDGSNGSECEQPDDCTSNRCANPPGVESGTCTSGAEGDVCAYGTDCVSGTCSFGGACE